MKTTSADVTEGTSVPLSSTIKCNLDIFCFTAESRPEPEGWWQTKATGRAIKDWYVEREREIIKNKERQNERRGRAETEIGIRMLKKKATILTLPED